MEKKQQNMEALPLTALPPLPLELFILQTGLSPSTCKRYRRRGFLKTIVIARKPFVTREAVAEFNERAARGEFDERAGNSAPVQAPEGASAITH